eukprot:4574857-Prymnesium_polylepis.1
MSKMHAMMTEQEEKIKRIEEQCARERQQNDLKSALLGIPNSGAPANMTILIQKIWRRRAATSSFAR